MNEFELIERIFSQMQPAQTPSNAIEKGIGDDAAVMALPVGSRLVSCIDTYHEFGLEHLSRHLNLNFVF